jgi:predicted TIM-barrel fold metal-dependent hydrolase
MSMWKNDEWLSQHTEDILDPDREIVDPHHHLWHQEATLYDLDDLWGDTGGGHNITQTVFVECGSSYRDTGPDHLKPVGETEYVAERAKRSASTGGKATISGIVARADLDHNNLDETLDAHAEAGGDLFKGIRHAGAHAHHPEILSIPGGAPDDLYERPAFRQGVAGLGERGLTYDTWHYHYQNKAFLDLAKAVPDTTMILDHFGTPLGVGPYEEKREEIFAAWKDDVAAIAECPNVVAKIGGLAMPDNGFGWNTRATPPSSDEFAEAQSRYYLHMIACFGPERCMFESNFPVDRLSISYPILWNGLKKIANGFSDAEKDQMFSGTAKRVYRL